mmetsp:Transcript_4419/g.7721  ORF Transcript_4419/g.7721 Transcript_4419/m.7721 type:complete len:118 (-) Transcript_4419:140-493(-)
MASMASTRSASAVACPMVMASMASNAAITDATMADSDDSCIAADAGLTIKENRDDLSEYEQVPIQNKKRHNDRLAKLGLLTKTAPPKKGPHANARPPRKGGASRRGLLPNGSPQMPP